MTTHDYDAIVIGTGQAGPPLARRLVAAGWKVAIIERKLFGGTCVNTGCTPTKAMVASAYAAHLARRGADYGFSVGGEVTADMKQIKARADRISGASRDGLETSLKSLAGCTVYEGHGRFESPKEVRVGDTMLRAGKIFLNVGGRAAVPNLQGIGGVPFLTNSSVLKLDILPEHLIVVGGSYVGLEFAQMFRRFGSKVSVIEMGPRLISHEDEDVSGAIKEILEKEGIEIHLNAKCIRAEKRGDRIMAENDCGGIMLDVEGSHLLLATGRRPNTDDLGIEQAGLEIDQRGYVKVDDQLRTNVPGIWAMGDCNGKGAFTHTSYNDFEIVAGNLLDNDPRRVSDRITVYGLYVDPPLGRVGMTEVDAKKTGKKLLLGKRPMTRVGRAVEKGEDLGFMKAIVDAETKQILGAAILGPGGDEAVHLILETMYAKAPYTTISRGVNIHPTVSELVPTMLQELTPLN